MRSDPWTAALKQSGDGILPAGRSYQTTVGSQAKTPESGYWLWDEWGERDKWAGIETDASVSDWRQGVPFPSEPAPLLLKTTNKHRFPDVLRAGCGVPIVSPRLVAILDRHGADAGYHPVVVRSHAKDELIRSFRAANITRLVACLDRERAEIRLSGRGTILGVENFHLIADQIPRRDDGSPVAWFRLAEYHRHILVSDALKRDIEADGIAGVRFIVPEEYDDSMFRSDIAYSRVPQPTWEPADPEPAIEMVKLRAYKGSGQAALSAAMAKRPYKPRKGRAVDIEVPRDAEQISLGYHQLAGVELDVCADMPNLRDISVGANLLVSVDLAPLTRCSRLEKLSLSGNRLTAIDLGPLAGLETLREVHLFGNANLRAIDATALGACPRFESLVVDGNVPVDGIDAAKVVRR